MIRFAENLNKMITAGLGGALEAPRTEVAVGHRVVYTEASGAVVNFETNLIAPIKKLRVTMEPIQEGTGDPSPDNIRPITGRDSVTVVRTGVNVWDGELKLGTIRPDGVPVSASDQMCTTNFISVIPGELYYINSTLFSTVYGYDAEKNFVVRNFYRSAGDGKGFYFAIPANVYYILVPLTADYGTVNKHDISINYPSTDHDYHPGTVASVEVQLGQTVYGGTVDVTGVLTVEWKNIASYDGEALPGEWISDRDAYAPGTTPTTGAQVCYKLATPITIDLTPAQLSTLVGANNIWSDAGDVTLKYPYYEETEGY